MMAADGDGSAFASVVVARSFVHWITFAGDGIPDYLCFLPRPGDSSDEVWRDIHQSADCLTFLVTQLWVEGKSRHAARHAPDGQLCAQQAEKFSAFCAQCLSVRISCMFQIRGLNRGQQV